MVQIVLIYQPALLECRPCTRLMGCRAAVAQLVEQRIRNAKVASSTPASGTSKGKDLGQFFGVGFLLSGVRVGTV